MDYKDYIKVGREYLQHGENYFSEGDLLQASEKFWGAAAQFVKALASKRGWPHDGHADLFKTVATIAEEKRLPEIDKLFRAVNRLHQNFYEHWLTESQVRRDVEDTQKFCESIIKLLNEK